MGLLSGLRAIGSKVASAAKKVASKIKEKLPSKQVDNINTEEEDEEEEQEEKDFYEWLKEQGADYQEELDRIDAILADFEIPSPIMHQYAYFYHKDNPSGDYDMDMKKWLYDRGVINVFEGMVNINEDKFRSDQYDLYYEFDEDIFYDIENE